jgi:hypothetical protein
MQQERMLQKRTETGIIVAPRGEKRPNFSFSGSVVVTACEICLHGILKMPHPSALRTYRIDQTVQRSPEIPCSFQTIHARVVLHRLDDICKNTKRSNVIRSSHAVHR